MVFERFVGNVLIKFFGLVIWDCILLVDIILVKVSKFKFKKLKVNFVLKVNSSFKFLNLFLVILLLILVDGGLCLFFIMVCLKGSELYLLYFVWKWIFGRLVVWSF